MHPSRCQTRLRDGCNSARCSLLWPHIFSPYCERTLNLRMKRQRWNFWGFGNGSVRRDAEPDVRMEVVNVTRGTVLATRLEVANTGAKRSKGLLGRKGLRPGEGLWIVPCESVHTFFMQFAIDLIYLDRKCRIRKVRSSVGPWRISICWSAHSILELPAGTVALTGSRVGDTLSIGKAGVA
jgi:uncharacterized protein